MKAYLYDISCCKPQASLLFRLRSMVMGIYSRDDDYKWFKENQEELFKIYPNKFLIISGGKSLGAFDTFDEAMEEALKKMKAGEFLIQQCTEDTSPIQYFNRAVFFR